MHLPVFSFFRLFQALKSSVLLLVVSVRCFVAPRGDSAFRGNGTSRLSVLSPKTSQGNGEQALVSVLSQPANRLSLPRVVAPVHFPVSSLFPFAVSLSFVFASSGRALPQRTYTQIHAYEYLHV